MMTQSPPTRNKPINTFIDQRKFYLEGSAGTNRGEIQKWLADDFKLLKAAYKALKKEQEICTIMHPQAPQKLNSFFYVPRIIQSGRKDTPVMPLDLIHDDEDTAVLISGRLGQGKSMLLRYLQFLELNVGTTLPIFLELQKVKSGIKLTEEIIKKINLLGLECSSKLFKFLLAKGHISIFLDGYDEIQFEKRNEFDSQIRYLINVSPQKKVFVTSRFDTQIERVPSIVGYEIVPFNSDDHAKFIRKIIDDEAETNVIMKKIYEAREFDPTVLDTPLLLTWFVMVYKVRRKIPKTKIGFYEELFRTILSRHDGIKGSLDRPSKSKLTDDDIEKVLHVFCYITSKENISDFEEGDILKYITKSLNVLKMYSVKADDYLYDLTHITCLLVRDGMSYGFIHDSIQSYFSACFIKSTNEENSKIFYKKANRDWRDWADELNFLYYLDEYRFNKFMIFPSLSEMLSVKEGDLFKDREVNNLSCDLLKVIYENSVIVFLPDGEGIKYIATYFLPRNSYTCHHVFNDREYAVMSLTDKFMSIYIFDKITNDMEFKKNVESMAVSKINGKKSIYLSLFKTLNSNSMVTDFCDKIREHTIGLFNNKINSSAEIISAEEIKGGLF